jgi:hypothetical protein
MAEKKRAKPSSPARIKIMVIRFIFSGANEICNTPTRKNQSSLIE